MSGLLPSLLGPESRTQFQSLIDTSVAAEALARDAAIAAAVPSPLVTLSIREDFVTGHVTTGTIGALGWIFAGGTAAAQAPEDEHPGILRRDTSTTINTVAYTCLRTAVTDGVLLASEFFDLTCVFRLNTTDTDTRLRIGLSSNLSVDGPVSAIYLEKKAADTQLFGCVRNASTESRTAALATSDTSWHKIRIRRINATTVGFTLDALTEVTLATNVPDVAVNVGAQITTIAAASKTLDLDFFGLTVTALVR